VNRSSKASPFPSKLPATVRNRLCQIANLRYADEGEDVRNLEVANRIPPPDQNTLIKISKGLLGERKAHAVSWEADKRGRARNLPEDTERQEKRDLQRVKNATLPRDQHGNEMPLGEAYSKYWEEKANEPDRMNAEMVTIPALAGQYQARLLGDAKEAAMELWPELWEDESRALDMLRELRYLLHSFWKATNSDAQDWYINQVRAYYARFAIQRKHRGRLNDIQKKLANAEWDNLSEAVLSNIEEEYSRKHGKVWTPDERNVAKEKVGKQNREMALASLYRLYSEMDKEIWDFKPLDNPFWKAVSELQKRARHKSKRPNLCKNINCPHPFFLRSKTQRTYCSIECSAERKRKSTLKTWHKYEHLYRPAKEKK
jgi:hypothetical protein